MKELVKPQKIKKEPYDAQAYCEGGNVGPVYCGTTITGDVCEFEGKTYCVGFSLDDDSEGELLF